MTFTFDISDSGFEKGNLMKTLTTLVAAVLTLVFAASASAVLRRQDGSGVKLKSGRDRMASAPPRRSIRAC